jgi:methionyl-tRNA formyltransferase
MSALEQLRIIFLGTPDFAVASLKALVEAGANVVAVVTAPDKPAGRGMQLQASAVKQYAQTQDIPVLQPEKLKDQQFLQELAAYKADLQVVVAFRMLPVVVWDMPRLGTINVHASLLPQYRGAAPINWAVINGETETGVTTFQLQHEIDTGNILQQKKVVITPEDNAGTVHDKLMEAGAELLLQTVNALADDALKAIPQSDVAVEEIKHAPKIFKQDLQLDWDKPVEMLHNFVRGMSPYPTAFTMLNGKTLKIYKTHFEKSSINKVHGDYDTDGQAYLRFATKDGWLYIDELQLEGKRKMDIVSFLRGFRF